MTSPICHLPPDLQLEVGDLIFIRVDNFLYRRVARATQSWTSHVGILYGKDSDGNWLVAESRLPKSTLSSIELFLSRSQGGRYSIHRLRGGLDDSQKEAVRKAVDARIGIWYHLGFNFDSKLQFCSKFVYEVIRDVTGREVGALESFQDLLLRQPDYPMAFWRMWYLGRIPWNRKTVSPASQYISPELVTLVDFSDGLKAESSAVSE